MTDSASPDPTDAPDEPQVARGKRDWGRVSLGVLLGVAALLGVGAGGVAVYVNNGAGVHDETAACPMSEDHHQALVSASRGEVAAFAALDEARPVPEMTFLGPDGEMRSMADWQGQTVLFNLWATWCAPCREEMPMLDNLQAVHGGDDFEVVAVSIDTRESADPRGFLEEIAVETLDFYHDPSAEAFNVLRKEGLAFGMPTTLLINHDGCLQGWLAGPAHWDHPDAVALIDIVRGS